MFVCSVVKGRTHTTSDGHINEASIEALLASGIDSVSGVVVPGGDLNYDELVVYDESAAVPAFLIVYAIKQAA